MVKKFKCKFYMNCLFGPAKLTKNSNLDKYKYSSYNIITTTTAADSQSEFSFQMKTWEKISLILELI